MPLRRETVPHCCTAQLIYSFGETNTGARGMDTDSEDDMYEDLMAQCRQSKAAGNALMVCFTNNEQANAARVLRRAGFAHSKWASKERHSNTKVRVWYKRLELIED